MMGRNISRPIHLGRERESRLRSSNVPQDTGRPLASSMASKTVAKRNKKPSPEEEKKEEDNKNNNNQTNNLIPWPVQCQPHSLIS